MEQLKRIWSTLSLSQQLSIGLAAVGLVAALMWLSSWRHEANFKPLFRGLASADAAEAVQKLRESGVEFRLADNGATILVSEQQLAETRLTLAREGLPKTGRMGFELFDAQNFGTTDFAEQVNYRRALEGELERTIATIGEVERARVHITFHKDSVFTESRQPAKAAVLLNLRRSATLSGQNVAAIAHLVASSVEGLSPNQITILDSNGELLNKPRSRADVASAPEGQLEYRVALEHDLQNKLAQTLDPILGYGKYRAGVSVDVDFSNVQQSEEKWDPTSSVMVSSQRTEESNGSQIPSGIPGTQSALPDAAPRPVGVNGVTRRTESTNYQTSRTVRHVDQQRGIVKRVTVAVLLDQEAKWQGQGTEAKLVLSPPPAEKIDVIRKVVTNVAGINLERGDQLTVETLPFSSTVHQDPPATAGPGPVQSAPTSLIDRLKDPKILGGAGAGMAVLLGLFVWMVKKKSSKKGSVETIGAVAAADQPGQLPAGQSPMANLTAEELARLEQSLLESLRLQPRTISKSDTLAKYLRQEIKQNPRASAQMLRTWLLEEGQKS